MANITDGRQDLGDQGGYPTKVNNVYEGSVPLYDDPAIINPNELATFPKQVETEGYHHDHMSHLVHNKRTPVRDGRNITRTDNHPDRDGFM